MYYNADYNVLYNVNLVAVAAQVLPRDCPLAANDGRPCSCGSILFIGYNWNEPYPSRWDKARAPILCIYVCACARARMRVCALALIFCIFARARARLRSLLACVSFARGCACVRARVRVCFDGRCRVRACVRA